jgi:hypothetical protein
MTVLIDLAMASVAMVIAAHPTEDYLCVRKPLQVYLGVVIP